MVKTDKGTYCKWVTVIGRKNVEQKFNKAILSWLFTLPETISKVLQQDQLLDGEHTSNLTFYRRKNVYIVTNYKHSLEKK